MIIGGDGGRRAASRLDRDLRSAGRHLQLLTSPALSFPRRGHTATLLPSGKILVAGGFDPARSATALPAELFDPVPAHRHDGPGPTGRPHRPHRDAPRERLGPARRRLPGRAACDGHVELARSSSPSSEAMGQFTTMSPLMTTPRAFHAASLLGDGDVLLTGGQTTGPRARPSRNRPSSSCTRRSTFTPTIPMATRARGALLDADGLRRDRRHRRPQRRRLRHDVPELARDLSVRQHEPGRRERVHATPTAPATSYIDIGVTDEDSDGGYVIIRSVRVAPGCSCWRTIDQQNPSTAPANFPNMQVEELPTQAVPVLVPVELRGRRPLSGHTGRDRGAASRRHARIAVPVQHGPSVGRRPGARSATTRGAGAVRAATRSSPR